MVYGGFDDTDGIDSEGLIITDNELHTDGGSTITDAYQGTEIKNTVNVVIRGNYLTGGDLQLLWSRRVNIQANIGDDASAIRTTHKVTGIVGNNLMKYSGTASGVVDIGHNVDPSGM